MGRINRKPYEFDLPTKIEILRRAGWKCERCGVHKNETDEGYLEIHHMLPIAIAIRYYPWVAAEVIKSADNGKALCKDCHHLEDDESKQFHEIIAQALLGEKTDRGIVFDRVQHEVSASRKRKEDMIKARRIS